MSEKKITPREAAIAVLKKAEELYRASTLAKAEIPLEKKYEGFKAVEASAAKSGASDPAAVAAAAGREKYGKEAFQHAAAAGKKMGKSDEAGNNPDAKADAALGEKVEQDVQEHEAGNADPAHAEKPMKGHIKLAKFMGRMEHKRGQKAKEMDKSEEDRSKMGGKSGMIRLDTESNQNQKGVGQMGHKGSSGGISEAGAYLRDYGSRPEKQKSSYAKKMAAAPKEIHTQTLSDLKAMPKPKLPG